MTTSFVRRGISLYKTMSEETRVYYRNVLGIDGNSKVIDVENALAKFERMRNNFNDLITEMEDELEILKKK
jgi:hypothetical protein